MPLKECFRKNGYNSVEQCFSKKFEDDRRVTVYLPAFYAFYLLGR